MKSVRKTHRVLAPFFIACLLVFVSCGHQKNIKKDGLFSGMEGDLSASTNSESGASEEGSDFQAASSVAPRNDLVGHSGKLTDTSNVDPTVLPEDSTTAAAPTTAEDKTDAAHAAENLELAVAPSPAAQEMSPSPAPIMLPETEKKEEIASFAVPSPQASMAEPPIMQEAPVAESAPIVSPDAHTPVEEATGEEPEVATASESTTPAKLAHSQGVPQESIWRKGHSLNRFYFLRSGDTPMNVSEAMYGTTARANDLLEWNGGNWKAGKVIYFVSAAHPDDSAMKSAFEELDIQPEAYTVKKGDWLSKIAETAYGSAHSWKEIAAINHLEAPDQISVGQTLNLFPAKIPVRAHATDKVAMNTAPAEAPAKIEAEAKPEVKVESAVARELAKAPVETKAEVEEAQLASAEGVGSFIEQHLIGIVAGALLLLAGYFIFARMRRSNEYQD